MVDMIDMIDGDEETVSGNNKKVLLSKAKKSFREASEKTTLSHEGRSRLFHLTKGDP